MTEDEIFQSFCKWMLSKNPGVACSIKMRDFVEKWISYKIDMLPYLDGVKNKMNQEFETLMHRNFQAEDEKAN